MATDIPCTQKWFKDLLFGQQQTSRWDVSGAHSFLQSSKYSAAFANKWSHVLVD